MVELVIMIATLTVVIFAWSKISKSLDWAGARVGETGDMLSDLTVSGGIQTSRGVAISQDSLLDTLQDSKKKAAVRAKEYTQYTSKLSTDEKKAMAEHEKMLKELLKRK